MSENILEVKGLTKDYGDFVLDKLTFNAQTHLYKQSAFKRCST